MRWRFHRMARALAVSGNREILIHSLDGATPPQRLPGLSDRILSLVFSKDGSMLVAAGGTRVASSAKFKSGMLPLES